MSLKATKTAEAITGIGTSKITKTNAKKKLNVEKKRRKNTKKTCKKQNYKNKKIATKQNYKNKVANKELQCQKLSISIKEQASNKLLRG